MKWADKRFAWILLVLCAASLLVRLLILHQYVTVNPLSKTPISDAAVYWTMAERIAGGEIVPKLPFMAAPLYPYVLGLIRAAGGDLTTVYLLQVILSIATAALLAVAARPKFGAGAALLGTFLFLLFMEPMSFSLRVLQTTLQLLVVVIIFHQLLRFQEKATTARLVACGIAAGLLCLCYPPAMLFIAGITVWLMAQSERRAAPLLRTLIPIACALIILSPVLVHNYVATGSLTSVQAGSFGALIHGNQPGSTGGYTPVPGTTDDRSKLAEAMVEKFLIETEGKLRYPTVLEYFVRRELDYDAMARFYRNKVVDFWLSDPIGAMGLFARKLYFFLTARHYSEIYQPAAEISFGVSTLLRLTPLRTAWIIGPALIGLFLMFRRPVRYGPELMTFLLPLIVVVIFFYTPRYRAPAIPLIALAAAWAILRALDRRERPWIKWAVVASLAAVLVTGLVNLGSSFDRPHLASLSFGLGNGYLEQDRPDKAVEFYKKGLAYPGGADNVGAILKLGTALDEADRFEEAMAEFERARRLSPDDPEVLFQIGSTLLKQRRSGAAEPYLEQAILKDPGNPEYLIKLGVAKQFTGKIEEALAAYDAALKLNPNNPEVWSMFESLQAMQKSMRTAIDSYEAALEENPNDFNAHLNLGLIWSQRRQIDESRRHFEEALRIQPGNLNVMHALGVLDLNEGKLEEARRWFVQVLEKNPEFQPSINALERIKEILEKTDKSGAD